MKDFALWPMFVERPEMTAIRSGTKHAQPDRPPRRASGCERTAFLGVRKSGPCRCDSKACVAGCCGHSGRKRSDFPSRACPDRGTWNSGNKTATERSWGNLFSRNLNFSNIVPMDGILNIREDFMQHLQATRRKSS
jgi:hypothetical protein